MKELSPEQESVLKHKGTEMPFSGKYYKHDEDGMYHCAACDHPLFSSETKFDSGSGWPSFYDIAQSDSVTTEEDNTHGMRRTEVLCKICGGHLGHVFPDGPQDQTGLRYCINSLALDFKKDE